MTDNAIGKIQNVTRFLWSVASLLAPWLVPIAPATFLGWSVYQTAIKAGMLDFLAVSAAIAAGVGLETVNIAANHAMLHLSHEYEKHRAKFGFSIILVLAYVAAGIISMVFLDVAQGVRILGIAMFMLAPVAIASQALTMDLARTREDVETERDKADEERNWRRGIEEKRLELEYQERLARITANADVRKERVRASIVPALHIREPASNEVECPQCNRAFATVQALNAHRRFCVGKIAEGTNGRD